MVIVLLIVVFLGNGYNNFNSWIYPTNPATYKYDFNFISRDNNKKTLTID